MRIELAYVGIVTRAAKSLGTREATAKTDNALPNQERKTSAKSGVRPSHRDFIESPSHDNDVLAVSHVGPFEGDGMGCIIALVGARATENANQLAREIADQFSDAFGVDCLTHKPAYHGKVSDKLELPAKVVQ